MLDKDDKDFEQICAIAEAVSRTHEGRRRRGPFPPTYTVSDQIRVGGLRGIVKSVKMLEFCPSYEVAFVMPPDGMVADTLVWVAEPDPGVLEVDDIEDIGWIYLREDAMRLLYKHGNFKMRRHISGLGRVELMKILNKLSDNDPSEFLADLDSIPHLRSVKR